MALSEEEVGRLLVRSTRLQVLRQELAHAQTALKQLAPWLREEDGERLQAADTAVEQVIARIDQRARGE